MNKYDITKLPKWAQKLIVRQVMVSLCLMLDVREYVRCRGQ